MMDDAKNELTESTAIERVHRTLGRGAFMVVVMGLMLGLMLFLSGAHDLSARFLAATLGLLIALPVVNVLAVLLVEIRRRDWTFALIAVGVVGLLVYSVWERVAK